MVVHQITTEKFRLIDHLFSSRSRIVVAFGIRRHRLVVSRRRGLWNLTRPKIRVEFIFIVRQLSSFARSITVSLVVFFLASLLFANDFRVELLLLLALITGFTAALSATKRVTTMPDTKGSVTYFGPTVDFCCVDDAEEP